ncbi:hypothetical protein NM688_g3786 [Phlebia brevispora]|uniref:Uncharacterized protein n=1 Tax=Phlebia brevispora TaxID=194682 RepID=A0ACC1T4R7_9APHY|nr:hypothetical protein NM688_g3786 [Phlebia brevispora]
MGTKSFASQSSTNSSYALPGTNSITTAEILEEDDEPPGSCRGSRNTEVTPPGEADITGPLFHQNLNKYHEIARSGFNEDIDSSTSMRSVRHIEMSLPQSQGQSPGIAYRARIPDLQTLLTPSRPLGASPGYLRSLKSAITYSPLNVLLVFIPVSWALHLARASDTLTFVCSALAIVPLAAQLTLATEQISLRTSQSAGGLINATFGNIVEMIIGGIALSKCDLALVQSSLLGGLISNLLLVLGTAFTVGGYRFHQQEFQPMAAQLNTSLMTVAVISLLVPAGFHAFLGDRLKGNEGPLLLKLSRGSAVVLICIYIAYLIFQFYSHIDMFTDTYELTSMTDSRRSSFGSCAGDDPILPVTDPLIVPSASMPYESPQLNTVTAVCILVFATALTYVTADSLVSSLNGMVERSDISKKWVAFIIIPIISNAAEHMTAVIVASKGKFDLLMSVAVGSCIQIALFVIPALIIVAWCLGKPLTLLFDPIETMCLFLSILLVKFSIGEGKTHWMSGVALTGVYMLIAISFWDYPPIDLSPLACT